MTPIRNLLSTALLFMLMTACAEIPQRELSTYVDAYAQARTATEQVLTDLVAAHEAIKAYQAKAAQPQAATTRGDYVPPTKQAGGAGQDAIGARLAALELVSQYNDVLVAIAEGKRVETLKAKVQGAAEAATQLLSLAGASFPGAGALTGLLQTVAGAVQKYEDRRAFAEALKAGAPLVRQILQFFIDETPLIVRAQEGVWDAQGAPLLAQANRARIAIQSEASKWGPPAAGSSEEKAAKGIEARMTAQLIQIRPGAVTLTWSGKTPVTMQALAGFEADLANLETAVPAYVENQRKSPALRALMDKYVGMLATTQSALDRVAKALDQPTDYTRIAMDLLDSVIAIKQQYAVYRAALKAN